MKTRLYGFLAAAAAPCIAALGTLAEGEYELVAGSGESTSVEGIGASASMKSPDGIKFNSDFSLLYVAEYSGQRISTIDPFTLQLTHLTGATLSLPICLEFSYDSVPNLYVSGQGSNPDTVQAVDTTTGATTTLATVGDDARGMAISNDGAILYVVSGVADEIWEIDLLGGNSLSLVASGFSNPYDLEMDIDGERLFVADRGFNLIMAVSLSSATKGDVATFAGSGTSGSADGAVGSASFYDIKVLKMAPNGSRLYVGTGSLVRIVDMATSMVSTLSTPGLTFSSIWGLDLYSDGSLYVGDEGANKIFRVGTGLPVPTSAPSPSPTTAPSPAPTPTPQAADQGTCLHSSSTVTSLAPDGRRRTTLVADLHQGDLVLAVDEDHKEIFAEVAGNPHSASAGDFYRFTIKNPAPGGASKYMITTTPFHTFPSCDGRAAAVEARTLKVGACLHTVDGRREIESIEVVAPAANDETYTLELKGASLVAVGGVFTHARMIEAHVKEGSFKAAARHHSTSKTNEKKDQVDALIEGALFKQVDALIARGVVFNHGEQKAKQQQTGHLRSGA